MAIVFQQTNRRNVIFTVYVLLIWFALGLLGSILGTFVQPRGTPPVLFGLAVSVPVILFGAGYLLSDTFRHFVRSLVGDPWSITALQAYRVLGAIFIVLTSRNALPAIFALPAGLGDLFIGVTAPLVALAWSSGTRSGKAVFVLWNVLGMIDLVMAVSLGTLATIQPGSISTAPLTIFPLSLIPTFLVPLSFILHLAGLGQFRYLSRKQAA